MATSKKLMIGGAALVALGSSRQTSDTDYLVNDSSTKQAFIHNKTANEDLCNANGHKFFTEIWKMEAKNIGPLASPKALLELKAFAFVQHCFNGHFQKADNDEFDMKFLVRQFGLEAPVLVKKYVSEGEYYEIVKVVNCVRK